MLSEMATTVIKGGYTAIIKQDGKWWIGWIKEVPGVNCQEKTKRGLLDSLEITINELLFMLRSGTI